MSLKKSTPIFLTLVITVIYISSCATTDGGHICDQDINAVVADVLNQSLNPDSQIRIPDQTFASRYGFAFILKDIEENRCNISNAGFSELAKEEYRLVNKRQLNKEASKRDGSLTYLSIDSVEIDGDVARIRIGAKINIWPKKKVALMCCCGGKMILDQSSEGWVFRAWDYLICA